MHGILDYLVGSFLIASPWILNIYHGEEESWILMITGMVTVIYSLLTDYEMGYFKKIPMAVHLTLDTLSAVFLGVSPWVFDFAGYSWKPHVIIAALELAVVLMTKPRLVQPKRATVVR